MYFVNLINSLAHSSVLKEYKGIQGKILSKSTSVIFCFSETAPEVPLLGPCKVYTTSRNSFLRPPTLILFISLGCDSYMDD